MAAHKRRHATAPSRVTPDTIVDHSRDVTAAERVVQLVGIGTHIDHAGAAVGLSPIEVRGWMRDGLNVLNEVSNGKAWEHCTYDERALATFAHAAIKAEGEWIGQQQALLEALARGGMEATVVTETVDGAGRLLDRTTKTSKLAPDARVVMWRLERRYPTVYGSRATVDIIGADNTNQESTKDRLRSRFETLVGRLELGPGEEAPQ